MIKALNGGGLSYLRGKLIEAFPSRTSTWEQFNLKDVIYKNFTMQNGRNNKLNLDTTPDKIPNKYTDDYYLIKCDVDCNIEIPFMSLCLPSQYKGTNANKIFLPEGVYKVNIKNGSEVIVLIKKII